MSENWNQDMVNEVFIQKTKDYYDNNGYQMWSLQLALCLFAKINPETIGYTIGENLGHDPMGLFRPFKFIVRSIEKTRNGEVKPQSNLHFPFAQGPIHGKIGAEAYWIDPRDFPDWAKKNESEFSGLSADHLLEAESAYQLRKYIGDGDKPIPKEKFKKLGIELRIEYLRREFFKFIEKDGIDIDDANWTNGDLAFKFRKHLKITHIDELLSEESLRKKPYIPSWR